MKKIVSMLLVLVFSLNTYSQSIFDEKDFFIFGGINYIPEVKVDKEKRIIKYTLRDIRKKIVVSQTISFEQLVDEKYLLFYNSIGFLSNENEMYFYDFINKRKYSFRGEYNKYNEGLEIGKFNPILVGNVLYIIDENIKEIRKKTLKVIPNSKQYWMILGGKGTDLIAGKIILYKCVKKGNSFLENKADIYEYNVSTNQIKKIDYSPE